MGRMKIKVNKLVYEAMCDIFLLRFTTLNNADLFPVNQAGILYALLVSKWHPEASDGMAFY